MADLPLRGSCLCGAVAFEVTGAPLRMPHCHWDRCRKVAGPFASTCLIYSSNSKRWNWMPGSGSKNASLIGSPVIQSTYSLYRVVADLRLNISMRVGSR